MSTLSDAVQMQTERITKAKEAVSFHEGRVDGGRRALESEDGRLKAKRAELAAELAIMDALLQADRKPALTGPEFRPGLPLSSFGLGVPVKLASPEREILTKDMAGMRYTSRGYPFLGSPQCVMSESSKGVVSVYEHASGKSVIISVRIGDDVEELALSQDQAVELGEILEATVKAML